MESSTVFPPSNNIVIFEPPSKELTDYPPKVNKDDGDDPLKNSLVNQGLQNIPQGMLISNKKISNNIHFDENLTKSFSKKHLEMTTAGTHSLPLIVEDADTYRSRLLQTYNSVGDLFEDLFKNLTEEGFYKRADLLRHPLIFYYGHTAVFSINKLVVGKCLSTSDRIDATIESLMAIGVDEMSWDDLLDDNFKWPSISQVQNHRDKARARISSYIENELPLKSGSRITWSDPAWIILMIMEHERIHLETSGVLIRQLPLSCISLRENSIFSQNICPNTKLTAKEALILLPSYKFINIPTRNKKIRLGRDPADFVGGAGSSDRVEKSIPAFHSVYPEDQKSTYGWDNEYGYQVHSLNNSNFAFGSRLVSNVEFLSFVEEGGYSNPSYWSEEGWKWVSFTKAQHPRFWIKNSESELNNQQENELNNKSEWRLRLTFLEMTDMPWHWPVECNALEASAFARYWSKQHNIVCRLPREEEQAYVQYLLEDTQSHYQSKTPLTFVPLASDANIGLTEYASPCSVTRHGWRLSTKSVNNDSEEDIIYDPVGNVWQHSRTPMHPYSHFRPHPIYDDFTLPTFDDRHNLILGGSWLSCGNEANPLSRFAFRRHFYQFVGFRMVQELDSSSSTKDQKSDYDPKNELSNVLQETPANLDNIYETDRLLYEYLDFHYGKLPSRVSSLVGPKVLNFPELCADICLALLQQVEKANESCRVLDLGGGVCRATFEMAKMKFVSEAVGLDFSARFILAAHQLKTEKKLNYTAVRQGDLLDFKEIEFSYPAQKKPKQESFNMDDNGTSIISLDGLATSEWLQSNFGTKLNSSMIEKDLDMILDKCHFIQGDASNLSLAQSRLHPDNPFDLILAANLIDRLYSPSAFLSAIGKHIKPGGFLVITSPYTWLDEYTKKENWIGAKKINGENVETLDALREILSHEFTPVSVASLFSFPSSKENMPDSTTATPVTGGRSKRKRVTRSKSNVSTETMPTLVLEGDKDNNAFSIPFVLRETERKFQFTFAQMSIWRKI